MITVSNLTKTYRKYAVEEGLWALTKSLMLRRYEEVCAVDAVSFTIEPATCVGLLGANGAGKTTLIKMLAGLLVPTSGSANVMGFTPWDRKDDYLRQIGVVMGQRQQLWIDVSAYENLKLNQVVYGLSDADFKERLQFLAKLLDVDRLLHVQVRKLSLGEKMKMELLAAFLHRPKLLFLDEPTIGLDVVAQERIREFIRDRVAQDGVTVLLTSHYMKDLEALCSRVLLIQSGKLVHDGPLSGLAGRLAGTKRVIWAMPGADNIAIETGLSGLGAIQRLMDGRFYLEVEAKNVSSAIRAVLDTEGVEDLSVETPPIEDSIREIFSTERRT